MNQQSQPCVDLPGRSRPATRCGEPCCEASESRAWRQTQAPVCDCVTRARSRVGRPGTVGSTLPEGRALTRVARGARQRRGGQRCRDGDDGATQTGGEAVQVGRRRRRARGTGRAMQEVALVADYGLWYGDRSSRWRSRNASSQQRVEIRFAASSSASTSRSLGTASLSLSQPVV